MNNRLAVRLLSYSIDVATLSAGAPRRKQGNAGAWLIAGVALLVAVLAWL